MGDEGVGVHAVRELESRAWPANVTLLDGGRPPCTVSVIEPRYASDFPRALSAHDIGLKDLVESAALIGKLPKVTLITISVAELQPMQMTLSPEVASALPRVVALAHELATELASTSPTP